MYFTAQQERYGKNSKLLLAGCFYYFWLITCPVMGQVVTKEKLLPEHYKLWSQLEIKALSAEAKYVSYSLRYPDVADTLFVRPLQGGQSITFPDCQFGQFGSTDIFIAKRDKGIELVNLAKNTRLLLPGVIAYSFTGNEKILLLEKAPGGQVLRVIDKKGKTIMAISEVAEFKLSEDSKTLAYISTDKGSAIKLLELGTMQHTTIIENDTQQFHDLKWGANDTALLFFASEVGSKQTGFSIVMFTTDARKIAVFPGKDFSEGSIVKDSRYPLTISEDRSRVFFAFEPAADSKVGNSAVQIWHSYDKQSYVQHEIEQEYRKTKVGMWQPDTGVYKGLMTPEENLILFSGRQKFALTADRLKNEPQWSYEAPLDLQLTDLESGKAYPFVSGQSPLLHNLLPSPGGRYILYFRERKWMVYDLKHHIAHQLAPFLAGVMDSEVHDTAEQRPAYGVAGWTKDDRTVFIYDRYDIWEIDPLTNSSTRLTKGREQRITYRLLDDNGRLSQQRNHSGWMSPVIKIENGMLLSMQGEDGKSGYARWSERQGLTTLAYSDAMSDQIKCVMGICIYRNQDFDLPPGIIVLKNNRAKELFRSNPQHRRFEWGSVQRMDYMGIDDNKLSGFLCFPAGYQSDRTYPMVVHIYEKQFQNMRLYRSPSFASPNGFNSTIYFLDDYLVFFPDMSYRMGEPGISAAKNLELAVGKVLQSGIADPKRVGLIGHSFGGFETNFTVTQTDLFAAAVAGAGVGDLESRYFSLNWSSGKSNIWRSEQQQFRMGASIFENPDAYRLNNPIRFANNITTPLLIWSGGEDTQVDWQQSVMFHIALRRLKKHSVLLLYSGEGHTLANKENQIDLSKKIKAWFDHYLKAKPAEKWINHPQN